MRFLLLFLILSVTAQASFAQPEQCVGYAYGASSAAASINERSCSNGLASATGRQHVESEEGAEGIILSEKGPWLQPNVQSTFLGFSLGTLFLLCCINVLLAFSSKQKEFVYAAQFLILASLIMVGQTGLLDYLSPVMVKIYSASHYSLMVLLFSAFALYTKAFLMIGEYEPFSKRILNVIALAGLPFAALAYFAQAYGEAISLTYALLGVAACIPALITKLRDRFINAFLYLPILCLQILALIINYEFLPLAYGLTNYFVALNIILQLQATVITFEIIYRFSAIILQAKSYQRTLEASVRRRTEELAVMAKSLREKNEELAEASRKDPLTGLSNRRHFNELSSMLLKDSSRNETPVSVLVIDADHFKSVNDTWGHDVGDEALKAIAQALRQCVKRPMDIVARFGGEEFVIILHNTELPGAIHVARNIQETLRGLPVQNGKGGSFTLTLSVGVLVAIPGTNADADSLIKVADGLVYDAKKAGRDCICYSESGGGNSGIVTSGVRAHNAKQRAD